MFYEIMKKFRIIVGLVAAFMFSLAYTSCEELEGLVDDSKEKASGEEAFYPKAYADKEVAAWYTYTEKDKDKTRTEAVYLFTDSTFVVTKNKVHTDGRYERSIEATGTYRMIDGNYKNGKAKVIVLSDTGEAEGEMTVEIKDGKLTTDKEDGVFVIQNNSKLPKASDPASGTINGGDNGGNNKGNNQTINNVTNTQPIMDNTSLINPRDKAMRPDIKTTAKIMMSKLLRLYISQFHQLNKLIRRWTLPI